MTIVGAKRQIYLDIDLVPAKHNWNVFANTLQVAVPIGHIFIGNTRRDIKHYDSALALDVVSITKTTKFLLASRVPNVKADCTEVGGELQRMNFDAKCCCD